MTLTIFYKGKLYNGIFVSTYKYIYDIYIDRQIRLAIFSSLLHGKSEKQEKFWRIFVIVFVQKYIVRVYF